MRKVILQLAVSLDGLIEGPNGEYDWCFTDQDYGMKHPILLGKGRALFAEINGRIKTRLVEVKTYNSGLAMMTYHVEK
jgi:dihydrofolate reductase